MSFDRRKKSWKLQSSDYRLMILYQLLRRTLVPVIVDLGLWTTVKSVDRGGFVVVVEEGWVSDETVTATGQRAAVPSSQTSCASAQPFWNLRVSEAVLISRLRVLQRIRWHELSVGAGNFWMEWAVGAMGKNPLVV
ncbi:hypothetical protein JMJ78_0014774 [Colletotrichum scovillei]|nr:hypothetical protein JMJ78_0014774 [Colletotrichum scovillei]